MINKRKFSNKKGITLVALIVTIIILLILVGITLNLVTGSEGILGKASNAINEHKKSKAKEELELLLTEYTEEYYEGQYLDLQKIETLEKYVANKVGDGVQVNSGIVTVNDNTMICTSQSDGNVLASILIPDLQNIGVIGDNNNENESNSSGGGNNNEDVSNPSGEEQTGSEVPGQNTGEDNDENKTEGGDESEENNQDIIDDPFLLKIGSIVTYKPSGNCSVSKSRSGYSATQYFASGDSYTGTNDYLDMTISKWRVFSINKVSGEVKLVPYELSSSPLWLGYANGYNNGIKVLNDVCSSLYGTSDNRISARSICIEDIEGVFDYNPVDYLISESPDAALADSFSYCPNIYLTNEKNRCVNGVYYCSGLDRSEQSSSSSGVSKTKNFKPYSTGYEVDHVERYAKTINNGAENISSYADILLLESGWFWVASRSLRTTTVSALFGLMFFGGYKTSNGYHGSVGPEDLYCSNNIDESGSLMDNWLFPVVSVNENYIIYKMNAGFEIQ